LPSGRRGPSRGKTSNAQTRRGWRRRSGAHGVSGLTRRNHFRATAARGDPSATSRSFFLGQGVALRTTLVCAAASLALTLQGCASTAPGSHEVSDPVGPPASAQAPAPTAPPKHHCEDHQFHWRCIWPWAKENPLDATWVGLTAGVTLFLIGRGWYQQHHQGNSPPPPGATAPTLDGQPHECKYSVSFLQPRYGCDKIDYQCIETHPGEPVCP
jgi:hypothetical protein